MLTLFKKPIVLFVTYLCVFSCGADSGPSNASPSPTGENPSPHDTKDHEHSAPHGGMVKSVGNLHIELKISPEGHIDVFVLDEQEKILPIENTNGKITLVLPDGVKTLPLSSHDDHLAASGPALPQLSQGQTILSLVDIERNGTPYSVRFKYVQSKHKEGEVHQHDPKHGGQVGMAGDNHLEVLLVEPGVYRVYLSDERRAPIKATLAKEMTLTVEPDSETPETLPLQADPTGKFLEAKGKALSKETLPVRVDLILQDQPIMMEFLLSTPK